MVHTFRCLDKIFMLDVDTCSLYEIDKITQDLVRCANHEQDFATLYEKYETDDIEEAQSELEELQNEGVLFSKIDTEAFKKPKENKDVKAMCLHISHDCELRCKYCFASTGTFHGSREMMSLETGKKALDFLVKNSGNRKNLEVDLFGGEPLLNWDVAKQIMEYGNNVLAPKFDKNFRFTVTTNGYGLTDEIIAEFENMHNVVISIDGRQEIHDNMRPDLNGQDTHTKVIEQGKHLKEARGDKSYYVRGTYTNANLDFAQDVLYLADQGFDQISMEPVVLDAGHKYEIKESDLPKIFEEYEKLAKEYIVRRKDDDKWFNFFHFMIDMESGPCISKRLTGCGAGDEYIAITPAGDIYPCHQFVGNTMFKMGNVYEDSFDRDMQKTFSLNHVLNKPECSDCWCKYFCGGGCIANAQNFNGDIMQPFKIACEMQKKRTECALAIYSIEKAD